MLFSIYEKQGCGCAAVHYLYHIESLVQTEIETLITALCLGDCIIISLTLLRGEFA